MARTNNLSNFLTDVAGAIREKTGGSSTIPASEFDTEIRSITTAGNYQIKNLNISQNGSTVVTPDTGYDAIEELNLSVTVNPNLQNKTITQNGSYSADQGYDGLGTVLVNVPSQQINNQNKTITQNGSYTADSGYTGLGTVLVNVPAGIKQFATEQAMQADPNPNEGDLAVVYGTQGGHAVVGDTFSEITFPATVTLPTAVTSNINFRNYISGSYLFVMTGTLRATSFSFRAQTYSGSINISYTSSDGITYTNSAGSDQVVDFGEEVTIRTGCPEQVLFFFSSEQSVFGGLFEYVINGDTKHFMTSLSTNLSIADTTVTWVEQFDGPVFDLIKTKAIMKKIRTYHNSILSTDVNNSSYFFVVLNNRPAIICPVAYTGTSSYYDCRPVIMFDTNGDIVGLTYCNNSHYIPTVTTDPSTIYKFEVFYLDYENTEYDTPFYVQATLQNDKNYTNLISSIVPIRIKYDANGTRDYYLEYKELDANITTANYTARYTNVTTNLSPTAYIFAKTQLTLEGSNQLLPNTIGYGRDGIVTGDNTIYQNLPFKDVAINIFGETQEGTSDAYHGANLTDYATNSDVSKLSYIKKATNLVIPDGCYGHNITTPISINTNTALEVPTGWNRGKVLTDIKQNLVFGLCYQTDYSDATVLFIVEKLDTKEILFQQQIKHQLNYSYTKWTQDDKYVCMSSGGSTVQTIYAYNKLTNQLTTVLDITGNYVANGEYAWFYDPNNHCMCYVTCMNGGGYTSYVTHFDTNTKTTIESANSGSVTDGNLMTNSTTLYWVYNSMLTTYNVSAKTFTRVSCAYMMYAGAYGTANPYALEDNYDYLFYYSHYIAKKSSPTTEYRGFLSRLIYNNEVIASSANSGYPRQKGNIVYMTIGHYLGKGQLVVSSDLTTVDIICDAVYYLPNYIPLTSYTSYSSALQNPTPNAISFVGDYIEYDYNGWSTVFEGWFKNYTVSDIDDFDYMLLPADSTGRLSGIFERVDFEQ